MPIWKKSHKGRCCKRGDTNGSDFEVTEASQEENYYCVFVVWFIMIWAHFWIIINISSHTPPPRSPWAQLQPSTGSETVSRGTNAKWTKPSVILLESDSSLTEHRLIDQRETTQEQLPNEGRCERERSKAERQRERVWEREREEGVNNIFISSRVCSSQSVRHH